MGDDKQSPSVYDEPPSGIVLSSRLPKRNLGFRLVDDPKVGCLAGQGFFERVSLEPAPLGFRARLAKDHERLPGIGDSLLLEIAASLEGGGAASLHLPVTLKDVCISGLVAFLDLEVDGVVEYLAAEPPARERATSSR